MASERIKLMIVEDEILVAQDIAQGLSKTYDLVGIAGTVDQALDLLSQHRQIDILLLDIKLGGKRDGIDLAGIVNDKYSIPFIFLTSHADRNLVERAKAVKPAAYILKPFHERELPIAIELALSNFANAPTNPEFHKKYPFRAEENQVLKISDRLFLKKDHHFQKVALVDISLFEADGNYTTIFTKNGQFIYSTLLRKVEEKLPSDQFMRVHRSYIINIDAVDGFEGNTLFVQHKRVTVSKQYREKVFRIFNPF